MITLLRHFYSFMNWTTELELALARRSGNMKHINHLTERLKYWNLEAQRFEWSIE